eukprot:NODE_917_length_1688_cov_20.134838_g750_i0.p1 GENE.NODE_917_length_1688_cov_20.134838_g750_i0~~NODE_917_length_1688_cov_20.134838_g750_i0.p1  ORF type:complete len:433 (+),score=64.21 NODE_917_length_1688_cov_20.134838_g750_i0:226-1524(+)
MDSEAHGHFVSADQAEVEQEQSGGQFGIEALGQGEAGQDGSQQDLQQGGQQVVYSAGTHAGYTAAGHAGYSSGRVYGASSPLYTSMASSGSTAMSASPGFCAPSVTRTSGRVVASFEHPPVLPVNLPVEHAHISPAANSAICSAGASHMTSFVAPHADVHSIHAASGFTHGAFPHSHGLEPASFHHHPPHLPMPLMEAVPPHLVSHVHALPPRPLIARRKKKLTLGAYDLRGDVAAIRMALIYINRPYDEKVYKNSPEASNEVQLDLEKLRPGCPFIDVPYLIDDEHIICRADPILRYLGRRFRLYGLTEADMSMIDMIMDSVLLVYPAGFPFHDPESASAWAEEPGRALLERLESHLEQLGSRTFLVLPHEPTIADFAAWEAVDAILSVTPDLAVTHPRVQAFHTHIRALPALAPYWRLEISRASRLSVLP